ncbi:MAG: HDOD domain-containing protein [Pseudomonadota bacterium]
MSTYGQQRPGKAAPDNSSNPFKEDESKAPARPPGHESATFQFVRQLGMDLAKGDFDLPPFPDTALKVQECIRDPDSDIQQLSAIVAKEPALAARLMRMANSAMMRRGPMEVTDIPTAISRTGMEMVQNAAVSFAAREAFKIPPDAACLNDLNALRRESVKVASLNYVLGKHVSSVKSPDEAMLGGLLNAVGKYYILLKASDHPALFAETEALQDLLAQWHTGVARAIVESWNFPESIAHAVDEQDIEERDRIDSADLSDILHISKAIVRSHGSDIAGAVDGKDALARMRLSTDKLLEILDEEQEAVESMVQALSG